MQVEKKCCEYNFKDKNVISIKEDSFPSCLQKSLDSIIKNEGYKTYDVYKKQISTDGGNYLGVLYEVDVKGKTADGDKESNIFIKNIIPNVENFKMACVSDLYITESFAYNELSKVFTEIQNEANVPQDERFVMAKSYKESNTQAIILENLARKGFKTCHRMDVVPLKFAELSLKQLARFHGLSFVLQKLRPTYFDKKLRSLKQPFIMNEEWNNSMKRFSVLSSRPLEYSAKKKVEKFVSMFLDKFPEYMEDTTSTGCCICYGDYRANNILMKEIDGEVTEIVPVDFQALYYGCPINDFIYFTFTATDQKFRKQHLDDLKTLYHESLGKFLKHFDLDVENIYPRKEFERLYRERLDYGLMMSLFVMPFLFACDDDVPDMSKDEMSTLDVKMDVRYEERVRGLVDEFTQWGIL